MLDNLIAFVLFGLILGAAALAQAAGAPRAVFSPLAGLGLLSLFLYLPVATALLRGQSLGKRVLGIRIVRDQGGPITWGRIFLRELLLKQIVQLALFPLFVVDSLWAAFDKERRSLHDFVVRTHVVDCGRAGASAIAGVDDDGVEPPHP